jgi:hypothetical protein
MRAKVVHLLNIMLPAFGPIDSLHHVYSLLRKLPIFDTSDAGRVVSWSPFLPILHIGPHWPLTPSLSFISL